jgi:aminoacrylate hydrolase
VPFLTLDDGDRLHYEVQGRGPPVLLVSGLTGAGVFWRHNVAGLAERFRVVLHDHRGTGRSRTTRTEFSVEQMAGDVLRLMDELDLERAHFIGHSTGGAIGQTLALDQPQRIDRLVLSATWTAADGYFRRLFAMRGEILRHGVAAYVRSNPLFLRPSWWIRDHADELAAEAREAQKRFPPAEIMLARIDAILRFDRRADLPRLAAPTLVIAARDDIVTPAYYAEELGRLIPDARLVILPQGGHFYPQVVPQEFCRLVVPFLEGRDPHHEGRTG